MTLTRTFICALAASASSSAIAQAVDAPPPAVEQIEQPQPAVPAGDATRVEPVASQAPRTDPPVVEEDVGGISEIIVTATRREERLQDIPVTVTAITGAELASSGISDTQSLTQGVPGLLFSRSGSGGHPVIRGVGPTGASSNGDEPNVASYIDGVYQPDAYGTLAELVEVQRIEVLRGPQGTVFGRNATGGLINIITPDPSFQFRGKLFGSYGRTRNDADDLEMRGYITGPLSGKIAADLAFLYRDIDGHIKDLIRGGTVGGKRVYDIRGKVLFQLSDTAKIIVTSGATDYDSTENTSQPVDGNTIGRRFPGVIVPDGPWQASFDIPARADYNRFNLSLRTSFEIGPVTLETTGAYLYSKVAQFADSDSSNIRIQAAGPFFTTKSYSQEVRLLSNSTTPLNWLIGIYLFRLDSPGQAILQTAVPQGGAYRITLLDPDIQTTSYAGFAEGTYQLAEPLYLTLGARYTHEKRSLDMVINGAPTFEDEFTVEKFTYRGALRFQVTEDTNLYASYGTGFKSGVYNTVTTFLNRTDPETIKALEGGIKSDISRNLRINLSAYRYIYDDMQVSARRDLPNGTFTYLLQNAASSKIYGGEIEVTAAPTPQLSITASAAYIHGRYEDFPDAQTFVPDPRGGNNAVTADVSGNVMQKAPKYTLNIAPRWEADLGDGTFDISANLFHSAKVYWDFANRFVEPAHTVLNGQIGYTMGSVRFSVTGTNITNEEAIQQLRVSAAATDMILIRPREVRIGAEWKF